MAAENVYRIIIAKDCEKSIYKAAKHVRQAVDVALKEISIDPYTNPKIKQLKGDWQGYWRYRIGNYRLIYRVDGEHVIVFAVAFGSRGDIYK